MADDMRAMQGLAPPRPATLHVGDSRAELGAVEGWATLVITSPPYPNNFDYADATRLEMTFFGDVTGWGGLQDGVRKHLVRSCTQHVSALVAETAGLIAAPEVAAIRDELRAACGR